MSSYYHLKDQVSELLRGYVSFLNGFNPSFVLDSSQSFGNILPSLHKLQHDHEDSVLSIAVLALTKSGKSTFINALIGQECMPSHMFPETARVCRVVCDLSKSEPEMEVDGVLIHGSSEILSMLRNLNTEARGTSHGNLEPIEICAPFLAFGGSNGSDTVLIREVLKGPAQRGAPTAMVDAAFHPVGDEPMWQAWSSLPSSTP